MRALSEALVSIDKVSLGRSCTCAFDGAVARFLDTSGNTADRKRRLFSKLPDLVPVMNVLGAKYNRLWKIQPAIVKAPSLLQKASSGASTSVLGD